MEGTEVRKLAALEDAHWWYRERRHLLSRMLDGVPAGTALDIGAAGGGNTRVLRGLGCSVTALEYGADGAQVASERGLAVLRGDATALPVADDSLDLVVAFDVLEHIVDDDAAVTEVLRVLRRDGRSSSPCRPTPGSGPSTTSPSTTSGATPGRRCAGAGAQRVRDRVD